MSDTGNSKSNLIKEIFETMVYGNELENLTQCLDWLKIKENRIFAYIDNKDEQPNGEIVSVKNATNGENICNVHVPEPATINTIFKKLATSKNTWIEVPPIKRAEIIYKLGTEVQKKQDLFIQLEIAARGILRKDTKTKALPLLTDHLQYYSGFCLQSPNENSAITPKGLVVAIVPDFNSLWILGCLLGPCLASGRQLVLQTGVQLSLATALLIELATQVGVPEGTIKLIPGKLNCNDFFIHPEVSMIAICDDLYKEEYLIANHFNKKLLNCYSSGTSMLVFDNCDLDSACYSVVNAAFGYKGMVPWATNQILVQENIFSTFIKKLKHKMSQVKIGKGNNNNVDISYPDDAVLDKIKIITDKARNEGVEVYEANIGSSGPILFIGSNIFPNNVIKEDVINVPIVTVVAFRTINEAVTLANNTRHGLGVSVWTENTSLVNEITGKLKVGNIWVNSHGLFAANISTSPYKTSGNGFFGGKEGFSEYVQAKSIKNEIPSQVRNKEAMEKAITEAKKAQDAWFKLTRFERMKNLQVTVQSIEANKSNWNLPEKWVDEWVTLIHECILNHSAESFSQHKSFNVISMREPCGIIAAETPDNKDEHNKRLIISALNEGNSVIVLNDCEETAVFYAHISKLLPKGVFTVVAQSQDAAKVAALHKELNVYVGEKNNVFASLPLKSSSKFKVANCDDWEEVRNKVSLLKNVWLNKGLSFM